MRGLLHTWTIGTAAVLLLLGAFVALWFFSVHAPDDAVREIRIGSATSPDWYLAEHRVAGKAYYTLRSARGDTPWDARYGKRPASLLYLQREEESLLLQRLDGSVLRLDLRTGTFSDAPSPSEPTIPLSSLFDEDC